MTIGIWLHGWLRAVSTGPEDQIELCLPDGSSVRQVAEALRAGCRLPERSAFITVVGGMRVLAEHVLHDGDQLHLYPISSGG